MQKFKDVLRRWERRELSVIEAGEMLGVSERQFRRYRRCFDEDGLAGLADRRVGKASFKRVPVDKVVLDAWSVPDPSHGMEREALPRALTAAARLRLGLHLDQAAVARGGASVRTILPPRSVRLTMIIIWIGAGGRCANVPYASACEVNRNSHLECCDPASTRHLHTLTDCEFGMTGIPNNHRTRRIFGCTPERAYPAAAAGLAYDNSYIRAEEEAVMVVVRRQREA